MTEFVDSFSEEIWEQTYKFYEDNNVDDTLKRVAKAVANVEETEELQKKWEKIFYEDLLQSFVAVPGGRILSNAGTDYRGTTLFNCYVGPIPDRNLDSLDGILKVLRDQAQTLKSEGGWGMNFSFIRPRGAFIEGIGVESPGAVRFMELFDKSSEIVTSGSGLEKKSKRAKGKIRKGAQMGVLDVWHPDIMEFITAKQTPGRLTKFNVSVNCTDEFMDLISRLHMMKRKKYYPSKIERLDKWDLIFPDTQFEKFNDEWDGDIAAWKAKGYPVIIYNTVKATALWEMIMESTYNRAEPGVLFLDRANHLNPLRYAEKIRATNPCGEQTLAHGNLCNLGSLNMTQFVKDDGSFDFDKLAKCARYMVRFLDNVITLSNVPLDDYRKSKDEKRRIGIGIMGWGSALYMMKIRFASEEASKLRDKIIKILTHNAIDYSIELAKEKGAFPLCEPEKHAESPYFKQIELSEELIDKIKQYGIRNSALFSNQPTGNTSILANVVSGGIEPVFSQEYIRTVIVPSIPAHLVGKCPEFMKGDFEPNEYFVKTKEGDEVILKYIDEDGVVYKLDRNRGLTKEVLCMDYGVRWLKDRGEWNPDADWAVTAANLNGRDHLNDLMGFSRGADSACSKTINIPYDYPYNKFKNLYLDAYNTGVIKGVTTYRSGTMAAVLSTRDESSTEYDDEEIIKEDVKLPSTGVSRFAKIKAEGRKWYIHIVFNEDQTRPIAFFCNTNNKEKTATTNDAVDRLISLARRKKIPLKHINDTIKKIDKEANVNKLTRVISLLLRHGVLIRNIVTELDKVQDVFVGSFLFQIKKYLAQYIRDGEKAEGVTCNECGGSNVIFQEGCHLCMDCSSTKCG